MQRFILALISCIVLLMLGVAEARADNCTETPSEKNRRAAWLLIRAGDAVSGNVFWSPHQIVTGDFDGDGIPDHALLGMQPGDLTDPAFTAVLAVFPGNSDTVARAFIPIDGQNGLCSPEVELRLESMDDAPSVLVLDDGACDVFRFSLHKDQTTLILNRN